MPLIMYQPRVSEDGKCNIQAVIEDGEVIRGEFTPPMGVELTDEAELWRRVQSQALMSTWVDKADLDAVLARYDCTGHQDVEVQEFKRGTKFQCTACEVPYISPDDETDDERWMYCVRCQKNRLFETVETGNP